jgi:hypothetical protein
VLLGTPALVLAGLIAAGAVVAGIVGPRLHRRHLDGDARSDPDLGRVPSPVEARRHAGPSWFTGPGA